MAPRSDANDCKCSELGVCMHRSETMEYIFFTILNHERLKCVPTVHVHVHVHYITCIVMYTLLFSMIDF